MFGNKFSKNINTQSLGSLPPLTLANGSQASIKGIESAKPLLLCLCHLFYIYRNVPLIYFLSINSILTLNCAIAFLFDFVFIQD